MREKFDVTIEDNLTGLEIFASQRKIEEFTELYNKLVAIGESATKVEGEGEQLTS